MYKKKKKIHFIKFKFLLSWKKKKKANLQVVLSSYFDGNLYETTSLPNGDTIIVGSGPETLQKTTIDYASIGDLGNGRIVLISSTGVIKSVVRVGDEVRDIAIDLTNQSIIVVGKKTSSSGKKKKKIFFF